MIAPTLFVFVSFWIFFFLKVEGRAGDCRWFANAKIVIVDEKWVDES